MRKRQKITEHFHSALHLAVKLYFSPPENILL